MTYCLTDTIYALSSGPGKGGVAVIRVSGRLVKDVLHRLAGLDQPTPRHAYFRPLRDAAGQVLDNALVLFFPGPFSFTGEDVAELQVHGGRAVIQGVFRALSDIDGCRPAERGEYSRRAVINGKMDLTAAEGLLDMIDAETEHQRAQAYQQMQGHLGHLYDGWRTDLTRDMAYLEAFIDFPEEDIPPEKISEIETKTRALIAAIQAHLDDNRRGERLRDGFQIAIIGQPNVGKSSLINALTRRDVAIVSQTAGTTRDVVEAHLDVDGFPVIIADTAGLREQVGEVEREGIRRAVQRAEQADLILHIQDGTAYPAGDTLPATLSGKTILTVWNKADLMPSLPSDALCISARTGAGLDTLWQRIRTILTRDFVSRDSAVITRERYRVALTECVRHLTCSLSAPALELQAEDLRLAARALGRITGRIDAEDLLDVIFRDFCIGK